MGMNECRYTCVEKDSGVIDSIQKCCNPLLREAEDVLFKSILKVKKHVQNKEINTTIVFLRRHNICTVTGVAECCEVEFQSVEVKT